MKGQVYMQASKAKNIYKQTKKGTNNHILGFKKKSVHKNIKSTTWCHRHTRRYNILPHKKKLCKE